MAQRRRGQLEMRALGRSAGNDPVMRLILAAARWPTYVQYDAGQLRAHVQSMRADVGERWVALALDVDHVRCFDVMLATTVRNLSAAVARYTGPGAPELASAWEQCRGALRELPMREIEATASTPGNPWEPAVFERWRGQKKILASYDKYVACAPDVEGRLGVVAGGLGRPLVDALRESRSLTAAAVEAHSMASPVAELRQHSDRVMDWNSDRLNAFERGDLTIVGTRLASPTAGTHVARDPIERLARLKQAPPGQGRLPGLSL